MPKSASAGLIAEQSGAFVGATVKPIALAQNGLPKRFIELGPTPTAQMTKGEIMNDQNRTLIRRGARELTPTEADLINGGFRTLSFCTSSPSPDGDQHVGELGC